MKFLRPGSLFALFITLSASCFAAAEELRADVCVYGATPAGILAAIAAQEEGASVVLIEPSRWLGGILGAGIKPMQDCAEPRAVGGLTKTKVFNLGKSPPVIRDWAARAKVWQQHIDYLAGLHHFLATDPRVPVEFREQTAALGLDKTMHPETQGWPHQLYVRITRRMQGPYLLTHADVLNTTAPTDSVGMALYGVDIYPVRRYAVLDPDGTGKMGVATEGNMFIGGSKGTAHPYPIPYRAITPKAEECTNLLVPVCISASYIAYASARMGLLRPRRIRRRRRRAGGESRAGCASAGRFRAAKAPARTRAGARVAAVGAGQRSGIRGAVTAGH